MTRADFWCRVLGGIELLGAIGFAAIIMLLWKLVLEIFQIDDIPGISYLLWLFIFFAVTPVFLTGLFTVIFANAVEQARKGLRDEGRVLLRVFMGLSGLWAAGVIGMAGLSFPALGLFAVLSLISVGLAVMGPDWTADLISPEGPRP